MQEDFQVDDFADLTDEEKYRLIKLTNPDETEEPNYNWNENFQQNILMLLLNDRWFAVQCRDLVSPNYFNNEVHQFLCKKVFDYLENYNSLPIKSFLIQEVESHVINKDPKIKLHYISEVNLLYEKYVPNLDGREYLLRKILNFAKLMALKKAFDESLSLIRKGPEEESTWIKIQSVLRDALLVDRNFDEGLNYFETYEERYERMCEEQEAREIFTSGFKSIDDALLGGGAHRGEMYSWIGLSGTGKSLALVTAAIRNITNLGKKVLYISLEMDEDKIAERFDAQISNIDINQLQIKKEEVKRVFEEFKEDKQDSKYLVIKQFPAGSMTVNTLKAYMQQLKMIGFSPDLLIIDYIGEMKDHPNMPTYESRYRIVRDLRGLATEENVCLFTAMQPNKQARDAQNIEGDGIGFIDDTNLADSYGQIRPLDGCWSINQMHNEKEAGVARIFVIKHRHGKSRFSFNVKYNMKTLAMDEISAKEYNDIWQKYMLTKTVKQSDMDVKEQKVYKNMKNKDKKSKKSSISNDIGFSNQNDEDDQIESGEDISELPNN